MTDEDGGICTQELICIERPAGTTERIKERKICVKRGVSEALFKALGLGRGEGHVMKQCMQQIYDDDGILLYTVYVEGLALRAKKTPSGKTPFDVVSRFAPWLEDGLLLLLSFREGQFPLLPPSSRLAAPSSFSSSNPFPPLQMEGREEESS